GDPLSERLEFLLHTSAPFSGESVDDGEMTGPDRFVAYRVSDTEHVLLDSAYDGIDYIISSSHLANPDFEPVAWFATKRQESFGIRADFGALPRRVMGDPRANRVAQILN
ncbi:hypothetical protein EV360DRAFT_14304, partial [Lentinula raphanica]